MPQGWGIQLGQFVQKAAEKSHGRRSKIARLWCYDERAAARYKGALMAVRKTKEGAALKRWFKEDWKDVRTGKACGRKEGEKRGTPYCRPTKRVSSKTPKTASEMSASEKKSRVAQKKRLGQPAGKPRRVKAVRRKKK